MKNILLLVAIPIALGAQTTINGTRVIKGTWDASGAASTLPNRSGAGSPAGRDSCAQVGETYFQTDAISGQNVWLCTAAGSPGTWAQVSGSGTSVPSVFGRTGSVTAQGGDYNAAQITNAADTTAANTFSQAQILAGGASLGSKPLTTTYTNENSTGTSANKTVKLIGNPSLAMGASTSDTGGVVGICVSGCGKTSTAEVALRGDVNCVFDGATTAGDYVQISSTAAGACHDAGAAYPSSGQVLGRVFGTNASGGTYTMHFFGPEIQAGLTSAVAQANRPWYCNSSNGTTSYTCSLNTASALTVYAPGMWLTLVTDTTNNGAATLNVDGVGVKNIRQSDGATAPVAGQITAGRAITISYDGTVWRLPPFSGVPFNATANQFVTAIDASGVATKAQPAFSNLSGSVAGSQMPALTGDVTSSAGGVATTLATVNASPGACGDATHVCQITTNGKGLVTGQSPVVATSGVTSLNGLNGTTQSFANDPNVTISSAGSTHTLGWSGLLGVGRGGLNANLSATGGAHQVLQQTNVGGAVTVGQLASGDISGLAASATTDTTNAANIYSGKVGLARGGTNTDLSATGGAHQVLQQTSLGGALTVAQLAPVDIAGLAASATTDTTNAANISSGTLPAARLPSPGAASLGGVQSYTAPVHQWINSVSTTGAHTSTQPAAADISGLAASATTDTTNANNLSSGTVPAARLPNPSGTTLGGVQSYTAPANQWINAISTTGVPSSGQPSAANISGLATSATTDTTNASNIGSGTLNSLRLPQFSGGDVTTAAAGSANLTIGANRVTNAMLAGSIDLSTKVGAGLLPAANLPSVAVQTGISNVYTAGSQNFAAAGLLAIPTAATAGALPTTCVNGALAVVTGAAAGQQIYEGASANGSSSGTCTWTQQLNSGGGGLTTLTGDVTATGPGSSPATVKGINGTLLSGLATGIPKITTGTGAISIAAPGTDYAPATSGGVPLKGNGTGGTSAATSADIYGLWLGAGCGTGTNSLLMNGTCAAPGNATAANTVTAPFSATPTFTGASTTAATSTYFSLSTAMTANITSSSVASLTPGQPVVIHLVQDGIGGRTFAAPTNWDACGLDPRPNTATDCVWWYDGANGRLLADLPKGTPYLLQLAPEIAAPTKSISCPSGNGASWFDSTDHQYHTCSNAGATATTVVADTGAANNFLTAISAAGVISKAQPTPANVGLGNVTNDAQTKAAVVPNTAPSAGQLLIGNAGGTAYAPVAVSGDCTATSTGAFTCTKSSGANDVTSAAALPAGGIVYGAGSQAAAATSAGTAKQLVLSGGAGAPTMIDLPETHVVPAANCNNATAGAGWNLPAANAPTAVCRAGTNNLGGALQWANNNTTTNAQFPVELPVDWDSSSQPYINIFYGSAANTSGTVKWTFSTACTKADGSVSDDPAFNAEIATSGKTMAAANRMWSEALQFTAVTSGNNCVAGGILFVKITSGNGTAASAVNVYKAVLTIPRLPTVQAN